MVTQVYPARGELDRVSNLEKPSDEQDVILAAILKHMKLTVVVIWLCLDRKISEKENSIT